MGHERPGVARPPCAIAAPSAYAEVAAQARSRGEKVVKAEVAQPSLPMEP
jgi:hypothetical protein